MTLTCRDVMLENPVLLSPEDTVEKAFKLICTHGMRYLPVVDSDGKYIGVFTSATLIRLLLPSSMTIEIAGMDTDKGLKNLGFYHMGREDFLEKSQELKDEKVTDNLSHEKNIPVTSPDTPVMDGVLLLHNYKRHVILVEPESRKFVGVVTIKSVLSHIFGGTSDNATNTSVA